MDFSLLFYLPLFEYLVWRFRGMSKEIGDAPSTDCTREVIESGQT